jgi:hypothetical protein
MTPSDPIGRDEFYIGYEAGTPPNIARHVGRAVIAVVALSALAAVGALAVHHRLAPASFAFGHPAAAVGELRRDPYPRLVIEGRTTWLVGPGKSGAERALGGLATGRVALDGTRIARGAHVMVEVVPGSARPDHGHGTKPVPSGSGTDGTDRVPHDAETAARQVRGATDVTLRGEIVDSKCFLGVMNPGEGTVHRDCARVCLRGGIPPMLLVRGAAGEEALMLLVDATGAPIGRQLADRAGRAVEVRGRVTRDGDVLVLATTPAQVVRLGR